MIQGIQQTNCSYVDFYGKIYLSGKLLLDENFSILKMFFELFHCTPFLFLVGDSLLPKLAQLSSSTQASQFLFLLCHHKLLLLDKIAYKSAFLLEILDIVGIPNFHPVVSLMNPYDAILGAGMLTGTLLEPVMNDPDDQDGDDVTIRDFDIIIDSLTTTDVTFEVSLRSTGNEATGPAHDAGIPTVVLFELATDEPNGQNEDNGPVSAFVIFNDSFTPNEVMWFMVSLMILRMPP
jgi:hypothetical protein